MDIDAFDYILPKHLIAQKSVYPADSSKLLCITENKIYLNNIKDLPNILKPGDLLVVNNTKVIKSRIIGLKGLKPFSITMLEEDKIGIWKAFVKGAKKLSVGDHIKITNDLTISVNAKGDRGIIYFNVGLKKYEFIDFLNTYGDLPLPPYIKVNEENRSKIHYQTLFAKSYGAVAAPTAGLHFTKNLKKSLNDKKIDIAEITLHVGTGTFLPVEVKDISKHTMHSEYFEIRKDVSNKIKDTKSKGGRIIAVGTTVLRALESAIDKNSIIQPFIGNTSIFITPGYKIKSTDYLLTNFHLPKSTLFILVCAYAGIDLMQKAYKKAMENNYRFYSLGDACLIKKADY